MDHRSEKQEVMNIKLLCLPTSWALKTSVKTQQSVSSLYSNATCKLSIQQRAITYA